MTDPRGVWLGLGTNLGDRAAHLADAIRAIGRHVTLDALSPVYETAPVGHVDQPVFWNMVARGHTVLEPLELLRAMKHIEAALGRVPSFRMGPRIIDIDILMYDDVTLQTPELVLPHPGLKDRPFVLRPLLDLDGDATLGSTGERLADLPAAARLDGIARLGAAADLLPIASGRTE